MWSTPGSFSQSMTSTNVWNCLAKNRSAKVSIEECGNLKGWQNLPATMFSKPTMTKIKLCLGSLRSKVWKMRWTNGKANFYIYLFGQLFIFLGLKRPTTENPTPTSWCLKQLNCPLGLQPEQTAETLFLRIWLLLVVVDKVNLIWK